MNPITFSGWAWANSAVWSLMALTPCGVYAIPKVECNSNSVATNTTPTGAYRGAGRPEAAAAIERAMDLFAAEINPNQTTHTVQLDATHTATANAGDVLLGDTDHDGLITGSEVGILVTNAVAKALLSSNVQGDHRITMRGQLGQQLGPRPQHEHVRQVPQSARRLVRIPRPVRDRVRLEQRLHRTRVELRLRARDVHECVRPGAVVADGGRELERTFPPVDRCVVVLGEHREL